MKRQQKTITLYITNDNKEFTTEADCIAYENHLNHLKLKEFHEKLIDCKFHQRYTIKPVFDSNGTKYDTLLSIIPCVNLAVQDNSYLLVNNYRIKYKLKGKNIVLILYNSAKKIMEYEGTIPSYWMKLSINDLKLAIDNFFIDRSRDNFFKCNFHQADVTEIVNVPIYKDKGDINTQIQSTFEEWNRNRQPKHSDWKILANQSSIFKLGQKVICKDTDSYKYGTPYGIVLNKIYTIENIIYCKCGKEKLLLKDVNSGSTKSCSFCNECNLPTNAYESCRFMIIN